MPAAHWTSRNARILAPHRREDVIIENVGDDRIVSDPRSGATHHLNGTAALVWHWCDGSTMTRDMARRLTRQFAIDIDTAQDDVDQLIAIFAASNLFQSKEAV
ncbi:MAG: PqqD family protein [Phycisphaeraceae bacterium]